MPPAISWADLRGLRVGVWGLGTEGSATLRRLRAAGTEPVIVDDAPERVVGEAALPTAGAGLDALLTCEVVVKSPGISRHRSEVEVLEAAGVAVVGGLGLWLESVDPATVLCITGTKGKSTTTAIAAHLARGLGLQVFAGGNLGAVPYDGEHHPDLWVIETSSYQALDLASTPPVVAVTSLSPDHLPWHGGEDRYYRDKLSLCTRPGAAVTVASAMSETLVEHRSLLGPEVTWIDTETFGSEWARPLALLGSHNLVNAGIARACLDAMGVPGADDEDALIGAGAAFVPLGSRLEMVGSVGGVDFIDDGLSTNVLPTIAALDAFPGRRVALIAGGFERDLDYAPLAAALHARPADTMVLTVYTTGPRIQREIEALGASRVRAIPCADLDEAVRVGWEWARPDGVVLLSPAAASFDAFDDYQHRSGVFRAAMAQLEDD